MNSAASLPARVTPSSGRDAQPVVFVNGVPEPSLLVQSASMTGSLDRREVWLVVNYENNREESISQLLGARLIVAEPLVLVDEQVKWLVLAGGVPTHRSLHRVSGTDTVRIVIEDDWSKRLNDFVGSIWRVDEESSVQAVKQGRLIAGVNGNRSHEQYKFGTLWTYVLQDRGLPWTVSTALQTVLTFAQIKASLSLIPEAILLSPIVDDIDLTNPLDRVLEALLEPYQLVVHREILRLGTDTTERLAIRSRHTGRRVRVTWPRGQRPVSRVIRNQQDDTIERARKWIGRMSGPVLESTFTLVPGWDPNLEGEASDTYDKTLSADFDTYRNVYRYWVLNEDGKFSVEPFNSGPAFDLAAFFGQPGLMPRTLRFQNRLLLSDTGDRLPPLVEASTDSGANWSTWSGDVIVDRARAAVYLDDDALPGSFVTAAEGDTAMIRVTASLQSLAPIETHRWRGNAFLGVNEPRIIDLSDTFALRRVEPGSIHFDDVRAGVLNADETDQLNELHQWLVDRMVLEDLIGGGTNSHGRLELAGITAGLRIGDRLVEAGDLNRSPGGGSQALTDKHAVIKRVVYDFGIEAKTDPKTIIDFVF